MVEIVGTTPDAHAVVASHSNKVNDIKDLIAEFEKLCAKGGEGDSQSIYYLRTQYKISLFMERINNYLACSDETIISAGIYMERWCSETRNKLSFDNIFKLLLPAILVSAKAREDEFHSNSFFGTCWSLPLELVNKLECDFLKEIGWDLYISEDQYSTFVQNIRANATK
eukprot:TRINITY_DN10224_c1_g1_i1.p1 TRINITY_DN10224_c1_g1~~TRINITY_DN10224_c1_g1_i1.p1  ORF type:complete len:187 (+),score=30.61 TRINITY_DN10224_c1_g1_i1:56-562(+)